MTKQQRIVFDAFRRAPGRKLTTAQLASLGVLRYSARIEELRHECGCDIPPRTYIGGGEWEYRLVSGPGVERDSGGVPSGSSRHEPSRAAAVSLSVLDETLREDTASNAKDGAVSSLSAPTHRPMSHYEYDLQAAS